MFSSGAKRADFLSHPADVYYLLVSNYEIKSIDLSPFKQQQAVTSATFPSSPIHQSKTGAFFKVVLWFPERERRLSHLPESVEVQHDSGALTSDANYEAKKCCFRHWIKDPHVIQSRKNWNNSWSFMTFKAVKMDLFELWCLNFIDYFSRGKLSMRYCFTLLPLIFTRPHRLHLYAKHLVYLQADWVGKSST